MGTNPERTRDNILAKIILSPLIGINKLLTVLLKHFLGKGYREITEETVLTMVDAGNESGVFEESSVEMINKVFEFEDLKAGDVMTHRVNLAGVEEKAPLDDIIYLALDKGFSRIPVFRENIDNIVGVIIVKDLLSLIGTEIDKQKRFNIKDFVREVPFIPESCSCIDAFKFLTAHKNGMAVVADEYGGTAGCLTLEDIIEAVMGNIQDEYDEDYKEGAEIKQIGKDKYEIGGQADPEEVLELFGLELSEEHEYDTIAGFVTDLLGYIPENTINTAYIDYKNVRFIVKEAEDNCIRKIIAVKLNRMSD
jgi:putative hemolysin